MRIRRIRTAGLFSACVLALGLCLAAAPSAPAQEKDGFKPLFNGRNLEGWEGDFNLWKVRDGMIVGSAPELKDNKFLWTKRTYSDFHLTLAVRLKGENSGVQFRSSIRPDGHAVGYQADIGKGWWGALYDELGRGILVPYNAAKVEPHLKPEGFNQYEIRAVGDHITLRLNGVVTADLRDPQGKRDGVIALQLHSGGPIEVAFRDLMIKELRPR